MKNYRDLEIYKMAKILALETHFVSLKLPKHELYEQGSQLRRSAQSIKDNIVEGYGRRRYKSEFIRFLIFAHSSNDEAINQLEMIDEIYYNDDTLKELIKRFNILGAKINKFIQYVETSWKC